jgi:hypothetical protein
VSHTTSRPDAAHRPELVVVSYLAHARLGPRGDRTQAILAALERDWAVELVAAPVESSGATAPRVGRRPARRALHYLHSSLLLDKFEPWSLRRFRDWEPRAHGALLIGFPFSPLVYAARRLTEHGIPYVVDAGDPWALTARQPLVRNLALARARREERRLWKSAEGAVLTTAQQADALRTIFPALRVLVRPNGFPLLDGQPAARADGAPRDGSTLRIAHFGDVSSARLDVAPLLSSLAGARSWDGVELHVFGSDWTDGLRAASGVRVVFHEPRPWPQIVALAGSYDVALVIGNRDPQQLPSKAIAYLQLPIPRAAIVGDSERDALAQYVADKNGWIALRADADEAAAELERHLSRRWTAKELAPPPSESWPNVASAVADFVRETLTPGSVPRAAIAS